jgi:hypothetical protein
MISGESRIGVGAIEAEEAARNVENNRFWLHCIFSTKKAVFGTSRQRTSID